MRFLASFLLLFAPGMAFGGDFAFICVYASAGGTTTLSCEVPAVNMSFTAVPAGMKAQVTGYTATTNNNNEFQGTLMAVDPAGDVRWSVPFRMGLSTALSAAPDPGLPVQPGWDLVVQKVTGDAYVVIHGRLTAP